MLPPGSRCFQASIHTVRSLKVCRGAFFTERKIMFKRLFNYFTRLELFLWLGSVSATVISYVTFGGDGTLTLIASLIGITSLILNANYK